MTDWTLFEEGVNRHGVTFSIYRSPDDRYHVSFYPRLTKIYKSGLIALDVARNTKITKTIDRGD